MSARRTALLRRSGPYLVQSLANGELLITPNWSGQRERWNEGVTGPGLLSRLGLAADLKAWLNAPYQPKP